jgi:glycosyltransferase involved in cell wall biosynthesis
VRDGENGFLIPSGDDQTLGRRLRQLLDDGQLRRRMGESGYARAHTELDEENYVRLFAQMVKDTVSGLGG